MSPWHPLICSGDSMKLSEGYITYTIADEQLLVSLDSHRFPGMLRSNKTAAFIIDCLKEETSEDEILTRMKDKYDVNDEKALSDIRKVVEQLRSIGALDEQHNV